MSKRRRHGPSSRRPARPSAERARSSAPRNPPESEPSRPPLLLIFGAALVLRGLHLLALYQTPIFDAPVMDSLYNTEWAQRIAEGEILGDQAFFRAPFYSYLLSPFYGALGAGSHTYLAIRLAQALLGSINCVLLAILGARLFGPRVGSLAGFGAALYWAFIYFEGEFLLPAVLVFHILAAFIWLEKAVREQRLRHFFVTGLFLGLFVITRPNILVSIPPLLVWLGLFGTPRELEPPVDRLRSWMPRASLLVAGVVLCVAPVTLHNAIAAGDFVLVASQGGVNFYIGNNPHSDGKTAVVPGTRADWWGGYEDTIRIAETQRGRELKPSEVSDYWYERGIAFLREQPAEAAALYAKKIRLLFDGIEISNNQNIYFLIHYTGFLALPFFLSFWMVAPLAMAGIVTLAKNRWWWLIVGFLASYLGSFLLFFVTARYRIPVVPFLILMAAAFLVDLHTRWTRRTSGHWASLLVGPGVVAASALLMLSSSSRYPQTDLSKPSTGHFTLGTILYGKGNLRESIPHFELSSRLGDPHRSGSLLQLGIIHEELGDEASAEAYFQRSVGFESRRWAAVAEFLIDRGEVERAEALLVDLPNAGDYATDLSLELARGYRAAGQRDRAIDHYEAALARRPHDAEARASLRALRRSAAPAPAPTPQQGAETTAK